MDTLLSTPNQQRGFTLIEVMIAIAILGILVTVAVPSFQGVIKQNRLITQANELITILHVARSEAIKSGRHVGICTAANPYTAPACDGTAGDWGTGWIAFSATPANATSPLVYQAATDDLLKVGVIARGLTVKFKQEDNVTNNSVHYRGNGTLYQPIRIRFSICDDRQDTEFGRDILISAVGRARVLTPASNCTSPTF